MRDQNENTPLMLWALALNEIPPTDIKALFPVLKHLKSSLSSPMETEWLFSSSTDLRKFFEQGVDPFVANLNGDTILNVFLSREKFRYAKNFIEAVLAVNPLNAGRLDNSGDTLLHVLCKCDDDRVQELIELVLNLGADPNFSNQAKDKPLHILCRKLAAMSCQSHTEEKPRDCLTTTSLKDPMTTVSAWAIGILKKYGADPEVLDGNDKTCLDIAKDSNMRKLQELLETPVEHIEIKALLPWEQKSVTHRLLLGQVARHQKSKHIEMFHYHCQPIGSGAFGHVHVGINEKDGREIAVKRIQVLRLDRPEDKREIENLLHLKDCEQVVKYHSYYKDDDFVYIILELMDGSLDELICPSTYPSNLSRLVILQK